MLLSRICIVLEACGCLITFTISVSIWLHVDEQPPQHTLPIAFFMYNLAAHCLQIIQFAVCRAQLIPHAPKKLSAEFQTSWNNGACDWT